MSLKYRDRNGALTVISGLTPGGNLEAGAMAERSGSFSITDIAVGGDKAFDVVFSEPMPDTDYTIVFEQLTSTCLCSVTDNTKTVNGFQIKCRNLVDTVRTCVGSYRAFKTYTVQYAEQNASDIENIKAKIPSTASSSNKLATSNELTSLGTTIDERLDALEDTIPSSASLQNQLITETELTTALQGKQDTLTFDTTPTEDSSNPVTSDGIYDALETKAAQTEVNDIVNIYGAKNVLPVSSVTQTSFNGVTITNYTNGTYLLNGTCTADASFSLHSVAESDFLTKVGKASYVLSGYPSISGNTGKVIFQYRKADDSGWAEAYTDNGQGVTLPYDGTKTKYTIYLLIKSGDSFSNVTFKPMIRLASIKDATYEPYTLTNQQMTPYIQSVSNPNLLDNPWFTVNQRGFSTSVSSAYGYDRWIGVYKYSADGVLLSGAEYIIQNFESDFKNFLNGKIITASVLYSDGTIESGSATYNKSPGGIIQIIFSAKVSVQINSYGNFTITARSSITNDITIRAVKLELGNASTLANDIAPNYATELEKCRRYFRSIYIAELLARINDGGANIRFSSMLIDGLRPGSKTVRFKDESNPDFYVRLSGGGTQFNLIWNTDFSLAIDGDSSMNINFALTADGKEKVKDMKNQIVGIWNYGNYIWVSADL